MGLQGHPQGGWALRPAHWEDRGREWDRAAGRKGLRTEGERRNREAYDHRSTGRKQHVPTGERTLSPGTEDAGLSSPHLSGRVTANYYHPSRTRAHRDPLPAKGSRAPLRDHVLPAHWPRDLRVPDPSWGYCGIPGPPCEAQPQRWAPEGLNIQTVETPWSLALPILEAASRTSWARGGQGLD